MTGVPSLRNTKHCGKNKRSLGLLRKQPSKAQRFSMVSLTDLSVPEAQQRLNQYKTLAMVNFAKLVLPTDEEVASVFKAAAYGLVSAQAMLETITPSRQAFVLRSLVWLLKLG